jgi:hypothetical protein
LGHSTAKMTRWSLPFWRPARFPDFLASFTAGEVIQRIEIPATGWKAFQPVASRRGVEAKSWLSVILGQAMADGTSIEETLRWLFLSEESTSEIERHFHEQEVLSWKPVGGWAQQLDRTALIRPGSCQTAGALPITETIFLNAVSVNTLP